jgi:hypothetical protein
MIEIDWTTFCAAVLPASAVGIWSIRQEGRINAHDVMFAERQRNMDERWDEVKARLVRIEAKLDQNGTDHAG